MKTGVDPSEWPVVVRAQETKVNGVSKVSNVQFSQTNLRPFTDVNSAIQKFNAAISALKTQTTGETNNLMQAGHNKQIDDANYGR